MGEEFKIDSAKAKRLAEELAARTGETIAQAVERALEAQLRATPPRQKKSLSEVEADWKAFLDETKPLRANLPPGVTSDHSDMYDEDGLPI